MLLLDLLPASRDKKEVRSHELVMDRSWEARRTPAPLSIHGQPSTADHQSSIGEHNPILAEYQPSTTWRHQSKHYQSTTERRHGLEPPVELLRGALSCFLMLCSFFFSDLNLCCSTSLERVLKHSLTWSPFVCPWLGVEVLRYRLF